MLAPALISTQPSNSALYAVRQLPAPRLAAGHFAHHPLVASRFLKTPPDQDPIRTTFRLPPIVVLASFLKVSMTKRSSIRIASRRRRIFPPIKRRKDTICILLRASTFLLRRLLDLISEDSFHPHSVLSSPSRLRYGRNSRASCAKTDGHSLRIPPSASSSLKALNSCNG